MKKRFGVLIVWLICLLAFQVRKPAQVFAAAVTPGKVTLVSVKQPAANQVTVTWKKTADATHYRIYYKSGGSWIGIANVNAQQNSFTHKSSKAYPLTAGKNYTYTVRAYNTGSRKFGAYDKKGITIKLPPAQVKLNSVKNSGRTVTVSWAKTTGATHYCVYYKPKSGSWVRIATLSGNTTVSYQHITSDKYPLKAGTTYLYTVRAYNSQQKVYGPYDRTGLSITIPKTAYPVTGSNGTRQSTLKKLLQTGLEPVGTTMYIWGGGWNKADTAAGDEAKTIGVSERWKQFFLKQTKNYNYRNTRYQIHDGLDCSGYIGWCIYNIRNVTNGKSGYVMLADKMAKNFAGRGWGTYRSASQVKDYRAGDIMSSSGHVYMVVGQCSDGSVVLLHSSPPGVQLCGTATRSGKTNSEAVKLATAYMKKYYPLWYAKFPNCSRGTSYLTDYAQMRWDITGKSVMTDPDGYRNKTASQILKDLFR